jgi:hypothetical protein
VKQTENHINDLTEDVMKDIKKIMKNEKEGQGLQKKKNEKIDFKDYHRFVNSEHSGGCDSGDV